MSPMTNHETHQPLTPPTTEPMNAEPNKPLGQCCEKVCIAGHNFPRYRQCSRAAVTVGRRLLAGDDEPAVPLCDIHSPEGITKRRARAEATEKRRARQYYAAKGWPLPDHLK